MSDNNRYNIPQDVLEYIRGLEKRIQSLERRASLTTSSIDEGSFTVGEGAEFVVQGGELIFRSVNNPEQVIARFGYDAQFGDGIIQFFRENGQPVFKVSRDFINDTEDNMRLAVYDRFSNVILAEGTFTQGVEKPWFELPFRPVGAVSATAPIYGPHGWERIITSGTFTTVYKYNGARQNGWGRFKFQVYVTVAGTTGEIRIIDEDDSEVLHPFLAGDWIGTVPNNLSYNEVETPGLQLPNNYGAEMNLGIQIRRTAGTGEVRVSLTQAMGGDA